MERKTIEIFLPYNEKGETKQKCFNIGFISNRMDREYREMTAKVFEVMALSKQLKTCIEKQGDAITSKAIKFKEKRKIFKVLKEEQEKIQAQIEGLGSEDFFDRRVRLAISILEANGVKDEQALNPTFWDEQVLASDFVEFIESATSKDYTEKKKASYNFNEDKLIAALKKYSGISKTEYMDMDIYEVQNASQMAGMPKEVVEEIWKGSVSDDYVKKALEAAKRDDS